MTFFFFFLLLRCIAFNERTNILATFNIIPCTDVADSDSFYTI